MGKDPAFLFYTADFLTGTMLLTDEQTGRYIRLLCLQHQRGHLTEKEMTKVCGGRDEDILGLFATDEQGRYFSEALDAEIARRQEYAASRRKNRAAGREPEGCAHMPDTCAACDGHMETEAEAVTVTETETETGAGTGSGTAPVSKASPPEASRSGRGGGVRFVPPTREQVEAYCAKVGSGVCAQRFVDFYASKGWMVGSSPMRDWRAALRSWRTDGQPEAQVNRYGRRIESFERPCLGPGGYDHLALDPFAEGGYSQQ